MFYGRHCYPSLFRCMATSKLQQDFDAVLLAFTGSRDVALDSLQWLQQRQSDGRLDSEFIEFSRCRGVKVHWIRTRKCRSFQELAQQGILTSRLFWAVKIGPFTTAEQRSCINPTTPKQLSHCQQNFHPLKASVKRHKTTFCSCPLTNISMSKPLPFFPYKLLNS